jgi:hypothetical protein
MLETPHFSKENWMSNSLERYWLKYPGLSWKEVTQDQFIQAERLAGFHPKVGKGLATAGFSQEIRGRKKQGRITYGQITEKDYGWDREFLEVATQITSATPK